MSAPTDGNFDQYGQTDPEDGSNVPPMLAEPIRSYPPLWQPDPVRQKLANYTLEDILNLPEDSPRVELVDGRMVPLPTPQAIHQLVMGLIWMWLRTHAPAERYFAVQAVGLALDDNHSREPDVFLIDANAQRNRHLFHPHEVPLVVEIVSPGTKVTDRFHKPTEYAAAGVQYYWRVELDPVVHVYAYRLSAAGAYELAADSAELLELDEPFPIKLSISEITP
jgi:Uma2 family endonuclease